jgi:hypothetical protein
MPIDTLMGERKRPALGVQGRIAHRRNEYCGRVERHDYDRYLALDDIELTKTKAKEALHKCRASGGTGRCRQNRRTVFVDFVSKAKITFFALML